MAAVNKTAAAVQQTCLSPGKAEKSIYSPNKPTYHAHTPCQTCIHTRGHLWVPWPSSHQHARTCVCSLVSGAPQVSSMGHEGAKLLTPFPAALSLISCLPTCRSSRPTLRWCLGWSGGRRKPSCPSPTVPTGMSPAPGPVPLRREEQAHTHMAKLI